MKMSEEERRIMINLEYKVGALIKEQFFPDAGLGRVQKSIKH